MTKEATTETAEMTRGVVDAGFRTAAVMRPNFERAQKVAGAFGATQRETARKSAEGTAEFGKLAMDLLNEQTKQSMQVAMAFGKLVKWDEVIQLQSELVRSSFERMNQLNSRYLELFRGVVTTATSTAKGEFKKAA